MGRKRGGRRKRGKGEETGRRRGKRGKNGREGEQGKSERKKGEKEWEGENRRESAYPKMYDLKHIVCEVKYHCHRTLNWCLYVLASFSASIDVGIAYTKAHTSLINGVLYLTLTVVGSVSLIPGETDGPAV